MVEKMMSRSVRLLCAGGFAVSLGLTGAAVAQDNTNIQRVEITGSSIKRATAETASPVQVVSREELLRSGKGTVAEYLQTLAVDGAGSLPTGFGNGFAAGSTAISLRGLGATSTLVLLNGRRMAPFARADDGQKSFTDLSTVPMQIVERIEILKDGASSTYGADAIAGVVNIILRKDFRGLELKADTGWSRYDDGKQNKASFTYGQGDLEEDRYNWVVNAEYMQSDSIANSDRSGRREHIGAGDLRPWGFPVGTQFANGFVSGTNNVNQGLSGAVRDPVSTNYRVLPGCASLSATTDQTGANGGCLSHVNQWRDMQPEIESVNLYTRGTFQVNPATQAYVEVGYSKRDTSFTMVPPSFTPTVAFPPNAQNPQGFINYGNLNLLAASHPQNPFGAPARIRYLAGDVGPSVRHADNEFKRFVAGIKGNAFGWDYDTGFTYSNSELKLKYTNMLNMNVMRAALSDPTSQYFPYYMGAEAGRNPASLYAALAVDAMSLSKSSLAVVDFKASRELFALPGGNLGIAVGAEHRREKLSNPSLSGSENGSINSNYVAAFGDSKVSAVYAELLAPVLTGVEISAAVRYDKYDNFNSTTPKAGIKWTPVKNFALRGTYTEGFRAPGPAEGSALSQSTGNSTVPDPVRCPGGQALTAGGATSTDCGLSVAAVKVGNPNLQPETSKGYSLGLVWDPFDGTSIALDGWKIKRSNEINPLPYNEAAALPTAIRSDNNLVINGQTIANSGTLIMTQAPYRNSSFTEVSGVDLDVRQRLRLGEYGRLNLGVVISHTASWLRQESETRAYQFAGTHGNCDTSNCAGTPKNKVNATASWDIGAWNFSGNVNYRDKMKNILFEGNPCASLLANGQPGTTNCEIASFTTVDLSTRWNVNKQLTFFASVSNVFDKVAPLDPLTYGALSYNPMDASGAIGRYFKVGASYKFF